VKRKSPRNKTRRFDSKNKENNISVIKETTSPHGYTVKSVSNPEAGVVGGDVVTVTIKPTLHAEMTLTEKTGFEKELQELCARWFPDEGKLVVDAFKIEQPREVIKTLFERMQFARHLELSKSMYWCAVCGLSYTLKELELEAESEGREYRCPTCNNPLAVNCYCIDEDE
jgi:DNA-directed RNA polymerase subunit RPC12/RpoP